MIAFKKVNLTFTPILSYTASLMSKLGPSRNTHFQFALGDNFYFDGVKSVDDPRFKTSFEDVFTDEHLLETPWFLNLGLIPFRKILGFPKLDII